MRQPLPVQDVYKRQLHILTADIENEVYSWQKGFCRFVVRHGLNFAQIRLEGSLN